MDLTRETADIVIRPHTGRFVDWRGLLTHRATFLALVRREIHRNAGSFALGALWVIARPLAMLLIFVFLKNRSGAALGSEGIPYPLYLYSGLVFWFTFADSASAAAGSTHSNASVISKIYFPRLYSPLAASLAQFYRLAYGLVPIVPMMFWFEVRPGTMLLLLPFVLLQAVVLAFAVGTCFAVLSVAQRDWEQVLGLLLYLGTFASPVIYSAEIIPAAWRWVFELNPMVGTLAAFRACLVDGAALPLSWIYSIVVTAGVGLLAIVLFSRAEASLLDEL
jgi:lipopolysaccharide transport system permease protein